MASAVASDSKGVDVPVPFKCKSCKSENVTRSNDPVEDHEYSRRWHCLDCDMDGLWCACCTKPNPLKDLSSFVRHFEKQHETTNREPAKINSQSSSRKRKGKRRRRTSKAGVSTSSISSSSEISLDGGPSETDLAYFDNPSSQTFFYRTAKNSGTSLKRQIASVVSMALSKGAMPNYKVSDEQIRFYTRLARHCLHISRVEAAELSTIFDSLMKCLKDEGRYDDTSSPSTRGPHVKVPTSVEMMRKAYINGTSSESILYHLPHPKVEVVDGHSYISLKQCVADILAHGMIPEESMSLVKPGDIITFPDEVRSVQDCRWYRNVLENVSKNCKEETLVLYLFEWSDDCDPLNSIKHKWGVWIMTVTINKPRNTRHPEDFTYLISLGKKADSHECVLTRFADELAELCDIACTNKMYSKAHGRLVNVHSALCSSMQDQLERRGICCLLGGNSQYHARWGFSFDYVKAKRLLQGMCKKCREHVNNWVDEATTTCDECSRWIASERDATEPFDNYPESEMNNDKKLGPITLTFEDLMKAVIKARQNIEGGTWTVDMAEAFLKRYCIKEDLVDVLLQAAVIRRQLEIARGVVGSTETSQKERKEKQAFIDFFDKDEFTTDAPYPAAWERGFDIRLHFAHLHLFVLGTCKQTTTLSTEWMSLCGINKTFMTKYAAGILEKFPNLEWLPLGGFTGKKLGAWTSSNHLAFCRLMPWFFSILLDMVPDSDYQVPTSNPAFWSRKDCHSWFAIYGFDVASLLKIEVDYPRPVHSKLIELQDAGKKGRTAIPVAEARKIICTLMKPEHRNKLPEKISQRIPKSSQVWDLARSLHRMMSALMSQKMSKDWAKECHVRILEYLDDYNRLDCLLSKARNQDKEKPGVVSHYNYLGLLNYRWILEELGPIRLYWEGSTNGEAFVQTVKKDTRYGLRKNWEKTATTKIMRKKTLNYLARSVAEPVDRSVDRINREEYETQEENVTPDCDDGREGLDDQGNDEEDINIVSADEGEGNDDDVQNIPEVGDPGLDSEFRDPRLDSEVRDPRLDPGNLKTYKSLVELKTKLAHRHPISVFRCLGRFFCRLKPRRCKKRHGNRPTAEWIELKEIELHERRREGTYYIYELDDAFSARSKYPIEVDDDKKKKQCQTGILLPRLTEQGYSSAARRHPLAYVFMSMSWPLDMLNSELVHEDNNSSSADPVVAPDEV